jgi:small subunit ribosomal protein S5
MAHEEESKEFSEKVVKIDRVAKVVKGGRRFSFNALTVIGDAKGKVGIGFGKANEVPDAIRKSIDSAKKNLFQVRYVGHTIPHDVVGRFKSSKVILKPCSAGTGIIAGAHVRSLVEKAGIQDILSKTYGSDNPMNIVKATLDALMKLQTPAMASKRRGVKMSTIFGEDSL